MADTVESGLSLNHVSILKYFPKTRGIAYLLESASLCGGVKVVLRQAEALMRRGHPVDIICADSYPAWFDGDISYRSANPFDADILAGYVRVIGTTPRLVLHHFNPSTVKKILHLVQGFEAEIPEAKSYLDIIQRAYSLPVLKVTVSPYLTEKMMRHFPGGRFHTIGQGLETQFFYVEKDQCRLSDPIDHVVLIGPLTTSVKQIQYGLAAFGLARRRRPDLN